VLHDRGPDKAIAFIGRGLFRSAADPDKTRPSLVTGKAP
jgi:hypothetical protein